MLFDRILNNEHLIFIHENKKTYHFIIVSHVETPIYPHKFKSTLSLVMKPILIL